MNTNIINKLENNLIDQIAAGEVVNNPSSIIKELIENSIDSKSKNVFLYLTNGGIDNITIKDDGIGFPSDLIDKNIWSEDIKNKYPKTGKKKQDFPKTFRT